MAQLCEESQFDSTFQEPFEFEDSYEVFWWRRKCRVWCWFFWIGEDDYGSNEIDFEHDSEF